MPTRAVSIPLVLALLLCMTLSPGCSSPGEVSPGVAAADSWQHDLHAEPTVGAKAMVVTADRYATEVGLGVLRSGGNAVDATVATALTLAVTYPVAGNIGGGGFLVLRTAEGRIEALDFREQAPAAASRDMYLDANGNLTDRSLYGALAAGVPGSVLGLWEAHRRHGSLPWSELVAPAIALADGFEVHESLAATLGEMIETLEQRAPERAVEFETTADTFLVDGLAPALGSRIEQPALAATLRRIAVAGADGFYRGETADLIVAEMQRGGGLIDHDDLANYTVEWREPIVIEYRGRTIYSMPPVSSGGATLAEMLNVLEEYPLAEMPFDSPERLHLLAETMKRAYSDRNQFLGDPAFVELPLERMISKGYAAERRSDIRLDRATPSAEVGPGLGPVSSGSDTTHFSIVAPDGSVASLTTTINTGFGSLVTVRGAGFLLNNEMDDFAAKPGSPNSYGLVQGEANAIAGGKRMLSSMTPTIVIGPDGDLELVTGTPGGGRIITTVLQTILNTVDHGLGATGIVAAPRLHHQHLPDRIRVEGGGFSPTTIQRLIALGHEVEEVAPFCDAQVIRRRPDGSLAGASDPRQWGLALGF